jgi:hypothetical protein
MLAKSGLPANPVIDADGNYTNRIALTVGEETITLLIPPPPDSWKFNP